MVSVNVTLPLAISHELGIYVADSDEAFENVP